MSAAITAEKVRTFVPMFGAWLKRGWIVFAALILSLLTFQHFFYVGVNLSSSLEQYSLFLVKKWDTDIKRGDLVAFEYVGENPYHPALLWVKRATGVPGDLVEQRDREFFVNGQSMGVAMEKGTRGRFYNRDLPLGPVGTIPPGSFYVHGDHPSSLDSRYGFMGWVPMEKVKGRAIVLF